MRLLPVRNIQIRATHAVAAFTIALALCAAAPSEAGATRQAVHGQFTAQIDGDDAAGRFRVSHRVSDKDVVFDRVEAGAVKLDATADDKGNLPSYHVFLITSDAATSADFGAMRLSRRGRAEFHFNTRKDVLPDGVTDVSIFGGGTIEIRLGDTVVLSAAIPAFIGTGDANDGSGGAFRRDVERLTSSDVTIATRGQIFARYANARGGVNEQIAVQAEKLGRAQSPYSVVAIDSLSAETEICTLSAHGRRGQDRVELDTRNGDTIPGPGSVQDLAGQTVELRDKDGNVVCSGKFPDVGTK